MVIMINGSWCSRPWPWAVAVLVVPSSAIPADWTISPSLRVAETYSDNVDLSPQAEARAAWTSELAPGIAIAATGPRLSLRLDYTLQERRSSAGPARRSQLLDAGGHGELWPEWLSVDAHAAISEQNISAFGPQITDPGQRSANSASTRSYSVTPMLRHYFRGVATAELRYAREHVRSDSLYDVDSGDLRLTINGDNGGRGWQWLLSADRRTTRDPVTTPVTNNDGAATVRVPLDAELMMSGTVGYERADYQALDTAPRGRYWSVGASWQPSERTNASASLGRRYFGQTHSLALRHRMHTMVWTLNYDEDITTTSAQFQRLQPDTVGNFLYQLWTSRTPDPQQRLQTVNSFLRLSQLLGPYAGSVNYFSHQYFLQKQWNGAAVWSGPRSTLALALNSTRRTSQTNSAIDSPLLPPGQLALDERTRQRTVQAGWTWRMSPRDNLGLAGSRSVANALDTGRTDRNDSLNLNLTRQLQPRLTATLDLRHTRHGSSAGGDFRENAASAALILLF